jgi:membrane protease YdiL (CAAX protease family)
MHCDILQLQGPLRIEAPVTQGEPIWWSSTKDYTGVLLQQRGAGLLVLTLPLALVVPPVVWSRHCVLEDPGALSAAIASGLILTCMMAVVVWVEELVFRGLLLGALSSRLGFRSANVVQACVFCALHMVVNGVGPIGAALILALGLVLGMVKRDSLTIAASYAVHVFYNTIQFASYYFVSQFLQVKCGEELLFVYGAVSTSATAAMLNLFAVLVLASRHIQRDGLLRSSASGDAGCRELTGQSEHHS